MMLSLSCQILFSTLKHGKLVQRSCHQNTQCKLNFPLHILVSFAEIAEILAEMLPKKIQPEADT